MIMMKNFQNCYVVLIYLWSFFFFFKILLRIVLKLYCSVHLVFFLIFKVYFFKLEDNYLQFVMVFAIHRYESAVGIHHGVLCGHDTR